MSQCHKVQSYNAHYPCISRLEAKSSEGIITSYFRDVDEIITTNASNEIRLYDTN